MNPRCASVLTTPAAAAPPPDIERLRDDFPALRQHFGGRPLVYLDNAATTHRPTVVLDTLDRFYRRDNANIHRGVHRLSVRATEAYEGARATVARFLNAARAEEIVFVRGATEAINLVAHSFARPRLRDGDEILVSELEHHANIVPWQLVGAQTGARLRVVPITDAGELRMDAYERLLTERTRLVALTHASNALGTLNPVREIVARAHAHGVPVLLDGAQAVAHVPVDVRALDCDFYAACGHKWLCGPQGTGFLYIRRDRLPALAPTFVGWGSTARYDLEEQIFEPWDDGRRFEFGTRPWPLYPALKVASQRIQALDPAAITATIAPMVARLKDELTQIRGVTLHTPRAADLSAGLVTISHSGPPDLGQRLWQEHRILVSHNPDRRWMRLSINAYVLPEELSYG